MEDPAFREAVMEIFDEEIIQKFDKREGDASKFYDIESEDTTPDKVDVV